MDLWILFRFFKRNRKNIEKPKPAPNDAVGKLITLTKIDKNRKNNVQKVENHDKITHGTV
jgi:hypothetical protein